jgi:hypothetical protein
VDTASYFIRSLLSEVAFKYENRRENQRRLKAKQFYREGPTGLIDDNHKGVAAPENETRYLSVPVNGLPPNKRGES